MTSPALAASLVWAALATGGLEVTGDSTCPAPADVASRLAGLAPAHAAEPAPAPEASTARVIVTHDGTALRLELLGPDTNELAARELSADGSCDDLAAAAAVVIAAWEADLDPRLAIGVALPARPPAAPTPAPSSVVTTPAPPAPETSRSRLELGLGLVVSDVGGDTEPGAMLIGALGRGEVGLDTSLQAAISRPASVGALANVASWTRVTLAAGPAWQPHRDDVWLDLHALALLGILHVSGQGLANPGSDTTAQLGVGAGARVAQVTAYAAVWLGLDVLGWPGTQRLLVTNVPEQGRLARLEVVGSLGFSLGHFR
jgi:hypothetical protein